MLNITHICMGHLSKGRDTITSVFKIPYTFEVELNHLLTLPKGEQTLISCQGQHISKYSHQYYNILT